MTRFTDCCLGYSIHVSECPMCSMKGWNILFSSRQWEYPSLTEGLRLPGVGSHGTRHTVQSMPILDLEMSVRWDPARALTLSAIVISEVLFVPNLRHCLINHLTCPVLFEFSLSL